MASQLSAAEKVAFLSSAEAPDVSTMEESRLSMAAATRLDAGLCCHSHLTALLDHLETARSAQH